MNLNYLLILINILFKLNNSNRDNKEDIIYSRSFDFSVYIANEKHIQENLKVILKNVLFLEGKQCPWSANSVVSCMQSFRTTFLLFLLLVGFFVIFSSPFIYLLLDMDSHHFHLFSSYRRGIFSAAQCNFFFPF